MKYSKLFGKTQYGEQGKAPMVSHQLLLKAGYISESVAGRYFFLPLGRRVQIKMMDVLKKEMDTAGAQEMVTPTLHPFELWEETNRTSTTGFELMKVKDRRGAEFALGGTAEEMFVDVVRKSKLSYKDLPFNVYQFSNKFRDEKRARGGLIRVREFIMKDAYSFHVDEDDFAIEYEKMGDLYARFFKKLGLETYRVEADNGYIGGEYCHEYQVEHEKGEGRFFVSEDGGYIAHEDVAKFELESINEEEKLKEMSIVDQPEWVKTMEDNVKHYGKDERFFLKNVVYRSTNGDIYIVTIRGDLDVNRTKLEQFLNLVGQLEEATDEDLAKIGTRHGYVHSWGHEFLNKDSENKVVYVADNSLKTVRNFVGGQKEEITDSVNVNYGRDFKHEIEGDVAMAQEGFVAPDGHGKLLEKRGIEVGNIFQLGYHYSEKMKGATFMGKDGKPKPYYMGCYGIGIGRSMATVVEKHNDEKGIVWPKSIAPFQVHIVTLNGGEERGESLYKALLSEGVEVLWDDRNESAGRKFSDADLIGVPLQVIIGKKSLDREDYECKIRKGQERVDMSYDDILAFVKSAQ